MDYLKEKLESKDPNFGMKDMWKMKD